MPALAPPLRLLSDDDPAFADGSEGEVVSPPAVTREVVADDLGLGVATVANDDVVGAMDLLI